VASRDFSAIYMESHSVKTTMTRRMRTLRQTCVLTPATKVAVDRSVGQPTTNFTYVIK